LKLTIEPTSQIIELNGHKARVWEGTTDRGTRVHLFVARVAIAKDEPPEAQAVFDRELLEQREPSVTWPMRLLID